MNFTLLPENGFHVARALVGSECTLAVTLEAITNLVHSPPARVLVALAYPDVFVAADHVPDALAHKPIALEGLDGKFVNDLKKKNMLGENTQLLPEGGGWLLVESGGESDEEARDKARGLMEQLKGKGDAPAMKLYADPHEQEMIWTVRESGLGATAHPRRERELGGLGRFRRHARQTRRLPARVQSAAGSLRISRRGSFSRAMERCVGVGACRKEAGTMCPSYQVTREEMHATRGRARLLWEMLARERPSPSNRARES